MKRIVLLRHGESLWNKENRFTGWTDVDLSDKGIAEACKAGDMLKEAGFSFEAAYTSYLKRAVKTLNCVLDRLNEDWIPVEKSWRLNEKHYGILQGLNKRETADKYGEEQVHIWRRSYGVSPEPVKERRVGRESVFQGRSRGRSGRACHGQGDGREQFPRFLLPDFSPEPDRGADRWYPS